MDEQGRYQTGATSLGAIYATLADLTLVEGTSDVPERMCFVGISDFARPARMAMCGASGAAPEADELLRTFVSVPVTTDPAAVEATLKQLSVPLCVCWDDQGQIGACPDE